MADIPAGTGLGSSGAFTVGALQALRAHRREHPSNVELAKLACHVELDRLGEPIGKQDQYIAAVGGVTAFSFEANDDVGVQPLDLSPETRERLEDNLMLFYTGIRRSASEVLAIETDGVGRAPDDLTANLDAVKALGRDTAQALERGDLEHFGALLSEQWARKLERSPTAVHQRVDRWIRAGLDAGATGGKLVGAGDGGFLLFYAESKPDLRKVMAARRSRRGPLRHRLPGRDCHRRGMTLPVAILAGGLGTRLRAVSGSTLPKALVPVADRPFIDHKLEELRERGVREIVFLIGHGGDQIRRHVGTGADFGLNVTYLDDGPRLLGTGGAIRARPAGSGTELLGHLRGFVARRRRRPRREAVPFEPRARHDDRPSQCRSDRAQQRTGRG